MKKVWIPALLLFAFLGLVLIQEVLIRSPLLRRLFAEWR